MRILIAIIHHWNPDGGGRHQSLRANPAPRVQALEELIIAFSRLGHQQFHFHNGDQAAYAANTSIRNLIDLHVITDGIHHVLDKLTPACRQRVKHFPAKPVNSLMLGFEVHKHLASQLDNDYDLYAYFEDDLIINDPFFFNKVINFVNLSGNDSVLLPQRYEVLPIPSRVNKLFIDGSLPNHELIKLLPVPTETIEIENWPLGKISFESPLNPHSGCFVLTHAQLSHWVQQSWWLDLDCSFISPLESAATLGILKTFKLFKPSFPMASLLEVQHWGTNFLAILAKASPIRPIANV